MKDFLSEYGFAILAAIVVILLIAMCTPVGNLIKNQVLGVVDSFAGKTEAKLAAIDDDAAVKVTLKEDGEAGLYNIVAESASENDTFDVYYRIKDQNGNWSAWVKAGSALLSKKHAHEFKLTIKDDGAGNALQNGNSVQVKVTDTGKADNMFYESNIVIAKLGTSAQAGNVATAVTGA